MKHLLLTFTLLLFAITSNAQEQSKTPAHDIVNTSDTLVRYRLYPTENMWTYLKLDTRTGRIWQVQWSLKYEERFQTVLSDISIPWKEEERNGRYTLYPTTNIFNFIMIDQIDGDVFQVQWSQEKENRGIVRIE